MVEMGSLDAMAMPQGQEATYVPKLNTLGLPFLFPDYDSVYKVLDSEIGDELVADLANRNMVQLAYWENGLRQVTNSKRAIESPADMAGLKIRTPEDSMTIAFLMPWAPPPPPWPSLSCIWLSSRAPSTVRRTRSPTSMPTTSRTCRSTSPSPTTSTSART